MRISVFPIESANATQITPQLDNVRNHRAGSNRDRAQRARLTFPALVHFVVIPPVLHVILPSEVASKS